MAKGIKKVAAVGAAAVMLLTGTMITGCEPYYKSLPVYEYGDFRYRVFTSNSTKEKYVSLDGLMEEGKTKEIIIVPSEIDGYPVKDLSSSPSISMTGRTEYDFGFLISDNLKSIYLLSPEIRISACETFIDCPNLEKIVYIDFDTYRYGLRYDLYYNQKVYIPCPEENPIYNVEWDYYYANAEYYYYTNVSYFYNYEGAENEGYYWVDHFTYGEKIEYIPEDPTREGYIFGGWYMEESCENAWDFEGNTLPEGKYNEKGWEFYQETKLFAKWIKA